MKNRVVARTLHQIADYLELDGANPYKIAAYRRAAQIVAELDHPVEDRLASLLTIGIGQATAAAIREIAETGESRKLQQLQEKIPSSLFVLLRVPGVGPKLAGKLFRELQIDSLEKLEETVKNRRLRKVAGFGAKMEQRIAEGIRAAKQQAAPPERLPIAFALPVAREVEAQLKLCDAVKRVGLTGSLRRMKETVNDLDFVIASEHPQQVMEYILSLPRVREETGRYNNKLSVILDYIWAVPVDFLLVDERYFATALHYFTGSKDHYTQMERLAEQRDWKINEYGVEEKKTGVIRTFLNEEELFAAFALPYIPPEIREGTGEIGLAQEKGLPRLIRQEDVRGDLHMHTTWSDGGASIKEMAVAARAKGYDYIAITDHSQSLKIARGLTVRQLQEQWDEIDALNKQWEDDFRILTGVEMDILADGRLDYPDDVLKEMDVVIASIHTAFRQNRDILTKRVIGALENNHVDIIAHPTGRLIGRRPPYQLDVEGMLTVAKESGTAIELNANPNRLDLHAEYLRTAKEDYGVKITVNTDAHSIDELDNMEVGIGTARRGWLTADDVINTLPFKELMKYLQRRG